MKRRAMTPDDSSDDSDDSVDYSKPLAAESPSKAVPAPVGMPYGIGAQLMQKMGYLEGSGLGASGNGITEPIEQQKRAKNSGLGSSQSWIEPAVRDSVPLEDQSVSSRQLRKLDNVHKELEELRNCLDFIERHTPINLDVPEFYSSFSGLAIWSSMNLSSVIEVCAAVQLENTPLHAFESDPILSMLFVSKEALSSSRYLAVLKTSWLSKLEAAFRDGSALDTVINHLTEYGKTIFAPVLSDAARLLASNPAALRAVLSNTDLWNRLHEVVPQFAEHILHFLSEQGLPEQLTDDEAQQLSAALRPASVIVLSRFYISGDLDARWTKFEAWQPALRDKGLSLIVLEKLVMPLWKDQLTQMLQNDALSPSWWEMWRSRFPVGEREIRQWLVWGLNTINATYDLGTYSEGHKPPENPWNQASPSDLIEHEIKNLPGASLDYVDEVSGRVVVNSHPHVISWSANNDVFYVKGRDNKEVPVSLDSIREYICKYL